MCDMCGCGSQAFMGAEMPNQNVYDIGPGQLNSPDMFNTDSEDTLGTETEFTLTSAPQVGIN